MREVDVQDKLFIIIHSFINRFKVGGVELTVEREYPIGNKRADIAVLVKDVRVPILIIETKRKYVEKGLKN